MSPRLDREDEDTGEYSLKHRSTQINIFIFPAIVIRRIITTRVVIFNSIFEVNESSKWHVYAISIVHACNNVFTSSAFQYYVSEMKLKKNFLTS